MVYHIYCNNDNTENGEGSSGDNAVPTTQNGNVTDPGSSLVETQLEEKERNEIMSCLTP